MKITLSSSANFGEQIYSFDICRLNPTHAFVMPGQEDRAFEANAHFKGAIVCFRMYGDGIRRHIDEFIGFSERELHEPMNMWTLDEVGNVRHLDTLEKVLRAEIEEREMMAGSMIHTPIYIISELKRKAA